MKKKVFGRQLKRDTNERKALFKGLMTQLVMLESIETTMPKAKAIKGSVEKLVTKAKQRGQESRQFLQPFVSPEAVEKLIADLSVRFAARPGGYTRVIKTGRRFSDNAEMAIIEWVEKKEKVVVEKPTKEKKTKEVKALPAKAKKDEKTEKKEVKEKPKKTEKKETKKKSK